MTMRKLLAILATLAILCTVLPLSALFSATADETNLVVNGGFEDGKDGWACNSGTAEIVNDANSGSNALSLTDPDQWGEGAVQYVPVDSNSEYTITWYSKRVSGTGAFNLYVMNADGYANLKLVKGQNWMNETSGNWVKNEIVVESGSASSIILKFSTEGKNPGTILLDDVSVVKVGGGDEPAQPAEGNLIVNGDFETGDASGWETWQDTAITTDAAKDGSFGAHLKGNGGWGGMLNQTMTVEAGKQYKLSFWINVNASGANVQVKDGSGASIEGAGGWFDSKAKDKLVEWTFTATDDKVLVNFCGGGNNVAEDVYVDNFSLVAVGGGDEPVDDALVKNGGFETGDLTNWINLWDSCGVEFVEGCDSEYAISITAGSWSQVRQNMIPVEPNTDYVLTADYKYAENFALMVKKGDDSGDVASVMLESSSKWAKGTLEFNTGDLTAICVLLIGWDGGGDAIIDNVVLAKKGEEPGEPDAPVVGEDVLNATFDTDEFDGILSSSDISVADGVLQFDVTKDWGNIYTELAVEANTEYQISFRAKSKLGKNVWVKLHKADWTGDIGQADATIGTEWNDYTFTLNSGDNTAVWLLVQFNGYAADGETIWFDYIKVSKVGGSEPVQPSAGLVTNGDFETGDNTGWDKHGGTVINADAAYKGQYGANLIGDGGWGGLLNQDVKVEKGETYIITLWVCPNTGGVNLQIKGATKVDEESDNTWMNSGELSGWTLRTVVAVADSDTMTLNFCGGGNNVAADIYLDEIVVAKKGETPPVDDTYPIKNAGFETGDLTSWENLWNACTYSFETGGYNKSNYALNFAAPGQWQQIRQNKIPVEPNTDYVVVGYVKNPINVNIVIKTGDDSANINEVAIENDMSNKWIRAAVEFNSGDLTDICVLLISREAGASAIWDDVQVYVKGTEPTDVINDEVVTEGPTALNSFGVATNRPATPEANLIVNGSFEDAEGGQWQSVLGDTLYVVDDETAPEGNKSLFFNTSGVTENNKVIFYMDVEPDTDYVFSAWVKGAFISDDNRFNATFGTTDWKDKFMVYPDAVFSNKDRQIVPTAWDNEWHLRSVGFNSGVNTKIGIGFAGAESQMWIDGIALYTVDNGVKYMDPVQFSGIAPSVTLPEEGYCDQADNLIVNGDMTGSESVDFWSGAMGYQNGFISFPENKYEFGTSMKYAGSEDSCNTHMIKWIDVKPHTDYTFSVDVRVVKDGGQLVLIDGKKRDCQLFMMIDFDQLTYGEEWFTTTVHFDTAEFDRIGIAVVDGGGVALIDNMRLFETANRTAAGDVEYVKPPYAFGSPEDPHYVEGSGSGDNSGSDSPNTGVSVVGAALAMALVPASAAVAFKLRRKKEDEE